MLLVKQIAIKPGMSVIGFENGQPKFIDLIELLFSESIYLQQLAIRQDAEVMLGMPLVADVALKFIISFGPALFIEPFLAFEDQVAVKSIGEAAANAQAGDVLFEQNRVRLLQSRKGCTQEPEEGVADGVFGGPALTQ